MQQSGSESFPQVIIITLSCREHCDITNAALDVPRYFHRILYTLKDQTGDIAHFRFFRFYWVLLIFPDYLYVRILLTFEDDQKKPCEPRIRAHLP